MLEQLFGQTRDGDGYYDGIGVLELKLNHATPSEILHNRHAVLDAIYNKATDLGLIVKSPPSQHVNISFWKDGKNILDDANDQLGKKLIEGVVRSMYDSLPVLIDKYQMQKEFPNLFELNVNREGLLRSASGRIEIRPSADGYIQDPNTMLPLIIAGANYGLEQEKQEHIATSSIVNNASIQHSRERFKVTSHILSNSTLRSNGTLIAPEDYITSSADKIAYELGLSDIYPEGGSIMNLFSGESKFAPFLIEFFKKVTITPQENAEGEYSITWPQTENGKYEFTIPATNIDTLPINLKEKLQNGLALNQKEKNRHVEIGKRIPRPAEKHTINVPINDIWCSGISQKLVIQPGYEMNNTNNIDKDSIPEGRNTLEWARMQRMIYSIALNDNLSKEFMSSLTDTIENGFPLPQPPLSVTDEDKELLKRKLSIKGDNWWIEEIDKDLIDIWKSKRFVEGINFSSESYNIVFKGVEDKDHFVRTIKALFSDYGIEKDFEIKSYCYPVGSE
ncbi:MAG: hypothetical protein WCJ33_10050, partial [Pseudomonadota bacterium]